MFVDYLVIKFSKKIVAVSNTTLSKLKERRLFSKTKKTMFIHNGINDPKCNELYSYKDYLDNNQNYCLILASYHAYKGHSYAIKAFSKVYKKFPKTKLLMFGYGKKSEKIRIKNQMNGLPYSQNIHLGGFLNNPACLIKNASVLLVPSQSLESFGLTIVEAMALKTPIVATDVGGVPEVIGSSGSGIVCSKNDSDEFGASIIKILTNDSLARTMGVNGRLTYEKKYHAEIMAKKYAEIL